MTESEPPNCCAAFCESVDRRITSGMTVLRISDKRFFKNTMKSARNSELSTNRRDGRAGAGSVLITDRAPGQADEDIFEGHLAACDVADPRVVPVFFDEITRGFIGEQRPVVDDAHSVADGLGLFHRVGGQQDASPFVSKLFDALPELTPRLRVEPRGRFV